MMKNYLWLVLSVLLMITLVSPVMALTWTSGTGCWTATDGTYNYIMWNATGSGSFTVPYGVSSLEYLVVGGGAGGGRRVGAGGGAGGLKNGTITVVSGNTFTTYVGDHGHGSSTAHVAGGNGVGSYFTNSSYNLSVLGGGGGGSGDTADALNGGSGGGAHYSLNPGTGVSGEGFRGGYSNTGAGSPYPSGGGGGAGEAGHNATSSTPYNGDGGEGKLIYITGEGVWYAGGGGSGSYLTSVLSAGGTGGGGAGGDSDDSPAAVAGTPATGGGGGGAGGLTYNGADGGSGIIIIKTLYPEFSGSGAGTSGDPYQITTYSELTEMFNDGTAYYKLMNDITASGTWTPIESFSGQLNGNNKTITGITIGAITFPNGHKWMGFVNQTSGTPLIKNIQFLNSTVITDTVTDKAALIYSSCSISGGSLTMQNVIIAGTNFNTSSHLTASPYPQYGVLVGDGVNCDAEFRDVGVLKGLNTGINQNFNSNGGAFGGLSSTKPDVTNFYYAMPITAWGKTNGYVFTYGASGTVTRSYGDSTLAGSVTGYFGVSAKTTTEMKTEGTYSDWDFDTLWKMSESGGFYSGYPILQWMEPAPTPPVTAFSANVTSGISPLSVGFTDSSTNTPTNWDWYWYDNETKSSDTQHPTTVLTTGTYNVRLYTSNSGGGDWENKSSYITVGDIPDASFTADKNSGVSPLTIKFTDTSTNSPTSWLWVFGDGNTTNSTVQSPYHTFTGVGTYYTNLTATNAYGSDTTANLTVTVGEVPVSSFTKDATSGTAPLTVKFTDTSTNTPTSWFWVFGDGSTTNNTVQSPYHTFAAAGTYNVNLTASNGFGTGSTTATQQITVSVSDPPVASFTKDKIYVVAGSSITFTDTSTNIPTSWLWQFRKISTGVVTTDTVQNSTHVFSTVGEYAVNLTATNDGGSDVSADQTVYAGELAVKDNWNWNAAQFASGYDQTTVGLPLTFTENSNTTKPAYAPYTVVWNAIAPNGTHLHSLSTSNPGVITPDAVGDWRFSADVTNAYGTTVGDEYWWHIHLPYNLSVTATPSSGQVPYDVVYSVTNVGGTTMTSYVWTGDGGWTSTDASPTRTISTAGTHTASVRVYFASIGGFNTSPTSSVTSWLPLTPSFATNPLSPVGDAPLSIDFVFYDGTGTASNAWLWVFGDGTTSTLKQPTHVFTDGIFNVNVTAYNTVYGISNTTATQQIDSRFEADLLGSPLSGTEPLTVAFTDNSTGSPTSWWWDFGDGTNSTSQHVSHTYADNGTYDVSLTISKSGCTNSTYQILDYVTVLEDKPQNVSWTPDIPTHTATTPPHVHVVFTANSTGGTPTYYNWVIGGYDYGGNATKQLSTNMPIAGFWVNLTVGNAMGASVYNDTYYIGGKPPYVESLTTDFASGTVYQSEKAITFTPTYNLSLGEDITPTSTYLWDFNDGSTATTEAPSHTFTAPGTFNVSFAATNAWGTSITRYLPYVILPSPPQLTSTLRWVNDDTGATITTVNTNTNVSYSFDTVSDGENPPLGYIADYFQLRFYQKDPSTGNWIDYTSGGVGGAFNAMYYGQSAYTVRIPNYQMNAGGINRWLGYGGISTAAERQVRVKLIAYNVTNSALYPDVTLGTADLTLRANPTNFANLGTWAEATGGVGFRLLIAGIILLIMMFVPFGITRVFNPYIEVIMALLGIGLSYYLGLIDLWIIFGMVIVGAIVIFFMGRGGGGGDEPVSTGGEAG